MGEGYGEHEDAIARYREEGEARAMALGNRGPVRFNADGSLHEKIVEAYWRCGFYVFEGVLGDEELAELAREVDDLIERAPVKPGSQVDKFGRPSPQVGHKHGGFSLVRPLSDPIGGTDGNNGRHPAKMIAVSYTHLTLPTSDLV